MKDLKIFISYRRLDAAHAEALYDLLAKRLPGQVFIDKNIELGATFPKKILDEISASSVVLLVMGTFWMRDNCGTNCLMNPDDWIRIETIHALRCGIPVVPVLLNDTGMPKVGDLPIELSALPKWQAEHINTATFREEQFSPDVDRLITRLMQQLIPDEHFSGQPEPKVSQPAVTQVFSNSNNPDFHKYVQDLMLKAKSVVLIGTGLNVLRNVTFRVELWKRAAQGDCVVEVYLADPDSPSIETRLIEEELGPKPDVGKSGIRDLVDALLADGKRFQVRDRIRVRLFTNYPTLALIIVDDNYFMYPYGYARLGNFSPVFQCGASPEARFIKSFLDEQYSLIESDSLDAAETFRHRDFHQPTDCAFALYFVPEESSGLYRFGSDILGYDVRKKTRSESTWGQQVGGAKNFGFHMTLCDALYFLRPQMRAIVEEIKYLVRSFSAFRLTGLEVKGGCPDSRSISIAAVDSSGNLEALHHELVQRVNRRASVSYYSATKDKPFRPRDSDSARAELMIKKYHAPYILSRFNPHFTLLTEVADAVKSSAFQQLRDGFKKELNGKAIVVKRLAMMSRGEDGYWVIDEEIDLKSGF